jgi:hypothetical protein
MVQLLVGEGYNHFEMLETLASPYGLLGRAMLDLMKLPQTDSGAARHVASGRSGNSGG